MHTMNEGRGARRSAHEPGMRWTAIVLTAICTLMLVLAGGLQPAANAADDLPETGTIAIAYQDGGQSLPGARIDLRQAATWSPEGGLTPTKDFAGYPIDWNVLNADAETFRQLAETLSGYASRDQIASQATQTTAADGTAAFTGLQRGLYLVTIGAVSLGAEDYAPSAMLAALPGNDPDASGQAGQAGQTMDVKLQPKVEATTHLTQVTVRKEWKNDNDSVRPKSVTMQLLRDGVDVQDVELNAANGWTYTWPDLEANHEWRVVEQSKPDGYTVLVDREGAETIVTNTYESKHPEQAESPNTGADVAMIALAAVILAAIALIILAVRRRHIKRIEQR